MAKPILLVVEPDTSYLAPLEWKVAELFHDVAEIHVISSLEYLAEYFSLSRTIDVLMIDESCYSAEFARHDIRKTYVLTDSVEKTQQESPLSQLVYLDKYSSLQNLVLAVAPREWAFAQDAIKGTQVVVTCSGAGGAGCTTLSTALARCRRESGKTVCYLNPQMLQNFSGYLPEAELLPMNALRYFSPANEDKIYASLKPFIRRSAFSYLPALSAPRYTVGISMQPYLMLVDQMKKSGEFDTIIVDIGTELNEISVQFLELADKVFIVTHQDEIAANKVSALFRNINCKDAERFFLVCNCFDQDEENAFLERPEMLIRYYIEKLSSAQIKSPDAFPRIGDFRQLEYALD